MLLRHRIGGLAAACISIVGLAPPEPASADDLELALMLEGGVAWSHGSYTYDSFEGEEPDAGSQSIVGPAGALHLELGWKVAPILRVGGFVRLGVAGATSPFIESLEVQGTVGVGATLRFEPEERADGPYGGVWVGYAGVVLQGQGIVGGVDGGYRWLVGERGSIGLGGSLSTQWSFAGEDGDFGHYQYAQGAIWPTVHLRFAHLLM